MADDAGSADSRGSLGELEQDDCSEAVVSLSADGEDPSRGDDGEDAPRAEGGEDAPRATPRATPRASPRASPRATCAAPRPRRRADCNDARSDEAGGAAFAA